MRTLCRGGVSSLIKITNHRSLACATNFPTRDTLGPVRPCSCHQPPHGCQFPVGWKCHLPPNTPQKHQSRWGLCHIPPSFPRRLFSPFKSTWVRKMAKSNLSNLTTSINGGKTPVGSLVASGRSHNGTYAPVVEFGGEITRVTATTTGKWHWWEDRWE